MLGINYFKAEPTEFVRINVGGSVKKEGTGISKIYLPFRTTFELVSMTSQDQPFSFKELTYDKQEVGVQGGFVYVISKPEIVLETYNFSINPKTKNYLKDDNVKLPEHILQIVRTKARSIVKDNPLEKLLVMSDTLSKEVYSELKGSDVIKNLGVDMKMLYFDYILPKPEISKALEAEYRESLLQKADKAIYARRAFAVEKERTIQENELKTKIELEEQRSNLVDLEGANLRKESDFKTEAIKKEIKIYSEIDPRTLAALGLYNLGKDAKRIENLMITPELMAGLISK